MSSFALDVTLHVVFLTAVLPHAPSENAGGRRPAAQPKLSSFKSRRIPGSRTSEIPLRSPGSHSHLEWKAGPGSGGSVGVWKLGIREFSFALRTQQLRWGSLRLRICCQAAMSASRLCLSVCLSLALCVSRCLSLSLSLLCLPACLAVWLAVWLYLLVGSNEKCR